jgi:prepilin-type processing-associated H-X9-DG protein
MPVVGRPKKGVIIGDWDAHWQDTTPLLISEIDEPSLLCMLAETQYSVLATYQSNGYGGSVFDASAGGWQSTGFTDQTSLDRHFVGSSIAFVDGHVKWLKKETVLIPNASNNAVHLYE